MIPEVPKMFDKRSQEGIMFEELSDLSDDYYVFHSFDIASVNSGVIEENEIDFVIFNPQKGIICLEAKAGQVWFENGCWMYGNGKKMKHNGPYNQARRNKWALSDYMENQGLEYENSHCKKLHAVWFPNVPMKKFEEQHLPAGGDINITLTSDAFGKIEESINRIYDYEGQDRAKTHLTKIEAERILECVLAPKFKVISIKEIEKEHKRNVFKRMLKEQVALLDYIDIQNNAIINGLAGTGKTVIALEKARRCSQRGEKVLFICYNSFLNKYLRENYSNKNISFYTIDGLACKICDSKEADYSMLKESLKKMLKKKTFPFQHVIIDEGQDFGKELIEEKEIVSLLKENVLESKKGGFYLFYDKNQMIQSDEVPQYIKEADCKLTLYRNCRNTENIATMSARVLGLERVPELYDDCIMGDVPEVGFYEDEIDGIELINSEIDKFINCGYTNITILTCKTEEKSIMSKFCSENKYEYRNLDIRFTTCRKFKGLESEAILLIDIDKNTFTEYGRQIMYVGISRAKFKLSCIINMSEKECIDIMSEKGIEYTRNTYKSFATTLNSKILNKRRLANI